MVRAVGLCLSILFFAALGWGSSAQAQGNDRSLFNGVDLAGWKLVKESNRSLWSVRDSAIVCGDGIRRIPENTFLYTEETFGDFEFRCLFRLTGDPSTGMINSGIQYRSIVEGEQMVGYQADIGDGYWGDIYDEHRRALLVKGDLSTLRHLLDPDGWNSYLIRCEGDVHQIYINGVKTAEFVESDPGIPARGVISLQLHSGGQAQVEFRDITLTEF